MNTRTLHVAQPPASYEVRPPIVLDCSVLAAALFHEDDRDAARQHLRLHELHAPFLIQSELANVAVKKMRRGFEAVARDGLKDLRDLAIDLHRIDTQAVTELAQATSLSAYDASYLWLAAEMRVPLLTFDARLAAAARTHLARQGN